MANPLRRPLRRPLGTLESMGRQARFHREAVLQIPFAIRNYPGEIRRLLGEVSLGSGALAAIGGTIVIISFLTIAIGFEIGLQGYSQLSTVGVAALSGFTSAYINTREGAPLIAAIALIATVGGGFTAQLGAMRVSEEVDALETMAVRPVAYLVSTRIVAGLIAVIPLYTLALIMTYASTKFVTTTINGQPDGTYDHYFQVFLAPSDILISMVKLTVMAVAIILIHSYYGYNASGGPVGVGVAVGRAVRTSLIVVMVIDLLLTVSLYGHSVIEISG
ncbi:ABC transporter permease [Spongisporangium articulatum]|uniref:ABC transporter permease n=1 Tax=Spongisporangium articulatum TaxID=3362603 RepID=A0ABW8ATN4_9ACTN